MILSNFTPQEATDKTSLQKNPCRIISLNLNNLTNPNNQPN